jgi:hypothetical protein
MKAYSIKIVILPNRRHGCGGGGGSGGGGGGGGDDGRRLNSLNLKYIKRLHLDID